MKRFTTDAYYPIDLDGLPASWEVAHVGDVIYDVQPGFASGRHNEEGIGVPHLRPMNVDRRGCVDLAVLKYVPVRDGPRVHRGDVLFNNTNSPELVGKTAHIDIDAECAFSNHMTRLRPPDGLVPKFVAYQLHYLWMAGYFLHRCVKHVNQASISSGTLTETVPFVVAPLTEQRGIVAEIEKHLTRLDAAVASLQRARANLRRYRASVLKAACEGRLVPTEAELARREGRDYEPGSMLLERILRERRARWEGQPRHLGAYREPLPPDTDNLPPLPEGWTWASVEQVGESRLGRQRSPKHHHGPNMRQYLRAANVFDGRLDLSDVKQMNFTDKEYKEYALRMGDVLLNEGQSPELIGRPAIYRDEIPGACFQNTLVRFRAPQGLVPEYALHVFRAYLHTRRFMREARITTNIAHLGLERFVRMEFPLPPFAEQQRIVAEVERHLSVIQAAEATVEDNLKRAERLRQAILRRAFGGELVPQDPTDEPASVLLERIRAAREQLRRNTVEAKRRTGRRRKIQGVPA